MFFLNEEIPIFGSPVEDASIFDIIVEVDFYPVAVFEAIDELTIVYFLVEIVNNALIHCTALLFPEVHAILVFVDPWGDDLDVQMIDHLLEVPVDLGGWRGLA